MFDTASKRAFSDLKPDVKKRIGARTKELWATDEYRNRVVSGCSKSAIKQHKTMSESTRKQRISKMSASIKQRYDDPEFRKMMRDKQRAGWEAKRKREGRGPSATTLWNGRRATGHIQSHLKKKISTPYGVFDSVMDMYRAKVCDLTPRSIRLRCADKKFKDWKYI